MKNLLLLSVLIFSSFVFSMKEEESTLSLLHSEAKEVSPTYPTFIESMEWLTPATWVLRTKSALFQVVEKITALDTKQTQALNLDSILKKARENRFARKKQLKEAAQFVIHGDISLSSAFENFCESYTILPLTALQEQLDIKIQNLNKEKDQLYKELTTLLERGENPNIIDAESPCFAEPDSLITMINKYSTPSSLLTLFLDHGLGIMSRPHEYYCIIWNVEYGYEPLVYEHPSSFGAFSLKKPTVCEDIATLCETFLILRKKSAVLKNCSEDILFLLIKNSWIKRRSDSHFRATRAAYAERFHRVLPADVFKKYCEKNLNKNLTRLKIFDSFPLPAHSPLLTEKHELLRQILAENFHKHSASSKELSSVLSDTE